MIYDLTSHEASVSSLSQLTNQGEADIMAYIRRYGQNSRTEGFLGEFGIPDTQLLEMDVCCAALHVTSNDDDCKSLHRHGLVGLQKALVLDTPLNRYLKKHGIAIDLARQEVYHRGSTYDVSKRSQDGCNHKLFCDFPTSAFFWSKNAVAYEGEVCRRPEFLRNLSLLLKSPAVESDWEKHSECYVIKFIAPMCEYQPCSFEQPNHRSWEEVKLEAIENIIQRTLWNVDGWLSDRPLGDHYAYLQPKKTISAADFLAIYTDVEYRVAYGIA